MTRLEYIQSCTKEELVKYLCEVIDVAYGECINCPAGEYCHYKHNGFEDWLEEYQKGFNNE